MSRRPQIAVDTSVAVPLVVQTHAAHRAVTDWAAAFEVVLSGHVAVETYAVLTRLPGEARVQPADAIAIMAHDFTRVITLPESLAATAHEVLAASGVSGGATYDGLVALAAREHGLTLVTRDARARSTYERLGVAVQIVLDG